MDNSSQLTERMILLLPKISTFWEGNNKLLWFVLLVSEIDVLRRNNQPITKNHLVFKNENACVCASELLRLMFACDLSIAARFFQVMSSL
jgi:hypothetical protein